MTSKPVIQFQGSQGVSLSLESSFLGYTFNGSEEFRLFQLKEWCRDCWKSEIEVQVWSRKVFAHGSRGFSLSKSFFPPLYCLTLGNSDLWGRAVGWNREKVQKSMKTSPVSQDFFGYQFLPAAELGGCSESPGGLFNVTAVLWVPEVILDLGVLLPQVLLRWQNSRIFLAPWTSLSCQLLTTLRFTWWCFW